MSNADNIPYGYCQCGCGEKTNLSPKTYSAKGIRAGDPLRFVNGHQKRLPFRWVAEDRGYETPCHIWQGRLNPNGYGIGPRRGDAQPGAHRVAWMDAHGEIPDGLYVLHRCDVPACVNVEHLFLGTQQSNMDDMHAKGRERKASGAAHPRARLTTAQVEAIRRASDTLSHREIACIAGASESVIAKIRQGASRQHG